MKKAVVMNMFYTGLGIARSLGEHGIPVIGLSSKRTVYGNFTRYAKTLICPDSREEAEALLEFLIQLGKQTGERSVLFPTRDHDVVFLDRFRSELEPYYSLVIPGSAALQASLDKWETYQWAVRAGVPTPQCWLVENREMLSGIMSGVIFPCVMKPIAAHQWRSGDNWQKVGGRKAIAVYSAAELEAEYAAIADVEPRVLLQELVPGGDEGLVIAACYMDRDSNLVAAFNTQKLLQEPEGFGTGCIVQAAHREELFEPTARLLSALGYTGIAEVEYKVDARTSECKLIEINPRPWDQHRLGKGCGVDLVHLAYCEHAGLPFPDHQRRPSQRKWIAEDTFAMTAIRMLGRRDPRLGKLFRLAKGQRTYAIWSAKDPIPFFANMLLSFLPSLLRAAAGVISSVFKRGGRGRKKPVSIYSHTLEGKSHG